MVKKVYYSFNEMAEDTTSLIRQVETSWSKPDIVAGFARGGLFPAVMMSHYWDIPMVPLKFSTRDFGHDQLDQFLDDLRHRGFDSQSKILIVDDIVDEGTTMAAFSQRMNGLNWKSAALIHNLGQNLFETDFYAREINKAEESIWIVFEYENFWTPSKFTGFPY